MFRWRLWIRFKLALRKHPIPLPHLPHELDEFAELLSSPATCGRISRPRRGAVWQAACSAGAAFEELQPVLSSRPAANHIRSYELVTRQVRDRLNERLFKRKLSARNHLYHGGRLRRGDRDTSAHVSSIAQTILRTAKEGERDPATLQRMALMELQISPRG
jgi:hypothetical protein